MATCVPISELKDSAAFSKKVAQAGEPVIVTKTATSSSSSSTQTYFVSFAAKRPRSTSNGSSKKRIGIFAPAGYPI